MNLGAQEKNFTNRERWIQGEIGAGIGGPTIPILVRFSAGAFLRGLGFEVSWMKIFLELDGKPWLFSGDIHMNLKAPRSPINPFFFIGIMTSFEAAWMNLGGGIKIKINGNFGGRAELRLLASASSEGGIFPLWFAGIYFRF